MSEQWSDKILSGLHSASEMLAEQKRQIEELRAERDAAREQRDAAREEAKKQHEGALEQNRLLKRALVELDEARNQLDDIRTEHACLQGDYNRLRIAHHEQNNELANLRTERELWHRDAQRRDEDRQVLGEREEDTEPTLAAGTGPVAMPTTLIESDLRTDTFRAGWQGVNEMPVGVRLTHLPTGTVIDCGDEPKRPANLRKAKQKMAARLAMNEPADEPVAPAMTNDIDECRLSIKGLHEVAAKHSREIGTLQDECRTLRERMARLERQVDPASDGKTATIPGTSAGLL